MKKILTILAIITTVNLHAKLHLPSFFSDNMVLQQSEKVAIWGEDLPNTKIIITSSWGSKSSTVTDENGYWKTEIETLKADNKPYELTIKGTSTQHIKNILFGEVWFASGQSNMGLPMKGGPNQPIQGGNHDVLHSQNSNIRLFNGKLVTSEVPKRDVEDSFWAEASPSSVYDFSAAAYYYAKELNSVLNIPIGIIHSSWGGTPIESWMDQNTLNKFKGYSYENTYDDEAVFRRPTLLYNAMINPYIGFTLRGFIWYQGENNRSYPNEYAELLPAMIELWRERWGDNKLSFYYVEICPLRKNDKSQLNYAFLRESQTKCMSSVENVGMVSTIDLGEEYCIHPARKRQVGERLALWALSKDYAIPNIDYCGPIYKSMEIDGSKVTLNFDNARGLNTFNKRLTGFEVAGEDKIFHPATAQIVFAQPQVVVFSKEVANPVAVRYNFKSWADGSLYNVSELPAPSFRTDNWDDITTDNK